MKSAHGSWLVAAALVSGLGCSSNGNGVRGVDAAPTPLVDASLASADGRSSADAALVDVAPARLADASLASAEGDAPARLTDASLANADGKSSTDGAGRGDAGADIARDGNDGPGGDASSGNDAEPVLDANPVCTPAQLAARQAPNREFVAWADMREDLRSYLTSFLPLAYIQDHFRFYKSAGLNEIRVQLEYGCETAFGFIEWGLMSGHGESCIRWTGPSQTWQVNVDRTEAAQRMTAAGCDVSNLVFQMGGKNNALIPGVLECDNQIFYPERKAGGQDVACEQKYSGECWCYKAICRMNADTGALDTMPASQACKS